MIYLKIYIFLGFMFYFYLFAKQLIPVINIIQAFSTAIKYVLFWPYYLIKLKDLL